MASTLNKVMLIGHLGDEVKMHFFEGGNCIGRFPIATNESYTNKTTGEKITTAEWHNIVVRNKLAETCEKYLSKGDKVFVEGRLKTRQWEDDSGTKKYNTEIHVYDIMFLKTKKFQEGANQSSKNETQNINKKSSTNSKNTEDDLPF